MMQREDFTYNEVSGEIYRGDTLVARLFLAAWESEEEMDKFGNLIAALTNRAVRDGEA